MRARFRSSYLQFIKFNLVGILNTAVDFIIFSLLIALGINYAAAQCTSYAAGMLNSYLFNKHWTFAADRSVNQRTDRRARIIPFIFINGVCLLISLGLLYGLMDVLHLNAWVSKGIATIITMVINFVGNKFWVFRDS